MKLLSPKKTGRDKELQEADKRISLLKAKIKKAREEKSLADSIEDWDAEKKKKWDEFCKWNQDIQGRKAKLLLDVEELEHKRDVLEDNLKAYN